MAVTLENIIYGFFMTIMLMAVSLWFVTAGCMDRLRKNTIYNRKISPKISLVISMVLRFIPMMIKRWREIHEAQIGMLCTQNTGMIPKAKQFTKELSILISWSLGKLHRHICINGIKRIRNRQKKQLPQI